MPGLSLDELVASHEPSNWAMVQELIFCGQIPPARVAEIERDYPEFAAWLEEARHAAGKAAGKPKRIRSKMRGRATVSTEDRVRV